MIKLFKRIRQKLLQQNRVSKYLIYAFGEIILVVIGILIALQINNWNENRKEENLKENYYQQLLSDFENDKSNIRFNIKRLELNIEAYKNFEKKLRIRNLPLDTVYKFMKKVDFTTGRADFNFQTFNILESTGDLKLFENKFRNTLMNLNTIQKEYIKQVESNSQVYLDLIKVNPLTFKDTYLREFKNQKNIYGNENQNELFANQIADMNHALRFKYFNENLFKIKLTNILNQIKELERMITKKLD